MRRFEIKLCAFLKRDFKMGDVCDWRLAVLMINRAKVKGCASHIPGVFCGVVIGWLCCFGMSLRKIKGRRVSKSDTVWSGHVSWHTTLTPHLKTNTNDELLSTNHVWTIP